LLLGPKFYQGNPEAANRLVVAYVRGIRDYLNAFTKNVNKAEIVSILTKATDVQDPTLYDRMAVIGVDPNGYVNAQSVASDQDWYFAQGLMQQKVDLSKVIDNQYVDYAVQRLGKYQP
ncbi:MAG: metal ABC transporter substrate-binding protein, partial [Dehalococcoidia bacterium]|nr:metal ABC transporter substrate-binding protein [Dehalococcoidia bacterium]